MNTRRPAHAVARERGFAATELVAGVAVLLVPVATLVATLPGWAERQSAARAIAREVARQVAGQGTCDAAGARALGATMAHNLGLATAEVGIGCTPGDLLTPSGELEATVTVRMPAIRLPAIGEVGAWTWSARHRQPVDAYAGVP